MYKIYSRPRIRIPKIFFNNGKIDKKKFRKSFYVIIVLLIAFSVLKYVLNTVSPIFDTLCESRAKSIATTVVNEESLNTMQNYSYDDMFTIEKDSIGNITMIKSNVTNINKITSEIAINIQKSLDKRGREDIEIALRKFYRS